MITIVWNNAGGEIDRCEAKTESDAVSALVEMVEMCGEISPGDTFVVTGEVE